ncbi:hypothetical protein GGX14DRAFT_562183 [Mycena pura]|uniref:Uncharacterized protein n=1 Tax=Mycena pura TaxID=153505 RepID=A0AAD6VLM2_9AGAR|nr:hypothetical protein GGX14DRAFT_562183 [Mycena pura]
MVELAVDPRLLIDVIQLASSGLLSAHFSEHRLQQRPAHQHISTVSIAALSGWIPTRHRRAAYGDAPVEALDVVVSLFHSSLPFPPLVHFRDRVDLGGWLASLYVATPIILTLSSAMSGLMAKRLPLSSTEPM